MQMNLDFCFMDDARIVAVAGWTTQPRPHLRLHVDDKVLTPIAVTRHVRRDLRSNEPMGLVALFDLSQLSGGSGFEKASIHLADGYDFTEIHHPRLIEDASHLVEVGVDEVFFALLRLIAQRRLVLSDERLGRDICARLRVAPSAARETEKHVLAIDRCQMTASGQGAVIGWFLPANASAEPLCALAIEDETIVPVDLLPGSMARADLSAYAPRYRFSGHDGYCGGWRFPSPPSGAARLLLMVPGEDFLPGVLVPIETVPAADLAQHVTLATLGIDDISDRDRLRRAMLPHMLSMPRPTETEDDKPGDGETLLILDHDLADGDLRDVLRRIGPHLPGRLSLQLLRPRLTGVLQNAINGAAREISAGLDLQEVSLNIARPEVMPDRVVFARSSVLFQFDLKPIFAREPVCARVTLLDPIGTVLATRTAQAERFARDLLPFALSMPAAQFFAQLGQVPECFLTEEARLRLLAEALVLQGAAELSRADIYRYFEGKSGPHCENFVDGRDWHAFDAHSRQLIEEASA
ncbi:hypothetical protein ACEUZ9_003179 [Paracoccus litorisediminis]|uniref:Uncharacterized protein n=1 Tax=Paracoccus litorisediminis TaxID=2006130 RepID=A0A844HN11_9RHOB|nr:hypothetical protein [Paracoccus litorisediminis]MTH60428.1 hypothetical protein [Paracoccus litorisediminis]